MQALKKQLKVMKKHILSAVFVLLWMGYTQAQDIRKPGDFQSKHTSVNSCAGAVATFPWFEGFEATTFPPACWSILNITGTNRTWERVTPSTGSVHTGTGAAGHRFFAGGLEETALITPAITVPNYGNPKLNFWSRHQLVDYQHASIRISTTVNTDIHAFQEVKVLTENEVYPIQWRNIEIPLNDFYGETIYIAFVYSGNNSNNWFIDDITVSHFESYIDMQALGIIPESGSYAMLSSSEEITVRLRNNGGPAATGFDLKLFHNETLMATEVFTGSIASLSEATYTFNTTLNLSTEGTHRIQVIVDMPGDQVPRNDTTTVTIENIGCGIRTLFPYLEGFENNGNELPTCWTQQIVRGEREWAIYTAAQSSQLAIEPRTPFAGNYRAVFRAPAKGSVTRLITPPMDLTALSNPILKFWHVQEQYVNDQDSLKILYRTSANGDWVLLANYNSRVGEWTERMLPLPEPSGQYYIAFEGWGEDGYSVQLDEIFIGNYVDVDIAVTAITPSGTHLQLSANQDITATIKNNGRSPVSGFGLSLFLDGNLIATETYTNTILGLGEGIYTFNHKLNLSISGTYELKVVTNLLGDENTLNDTLIVIVVNRDCNALTFPYEEGFEGNIFPPYCWTTGATNGTGWRKLNYGAHTGLSRASIAFWDTQEGWLISPKFSIPTGGEDYVLEFWSHVYETRFYTLSEVRVSTTTPTANTSTFELLHALTGAERPEGEWVRIMLSLAAYAGQDIYIAFRYQNQGGQTGHMWSIDDVNVFNVSTHIDAELVSISTPPSLNVNMSNQETVTIQVKNNGGVPISGFKLKLELNGDSITTETYTGSIASLRTETFTFARKLNLSANGISTIKVTVILDDDMEPSNDSKTKTVENRVCPPVTSFPWEGEFWDSSPNSITPCWINLGLGREGDLWKWWSANVAGQYFAISESYDVFWEYELEPDNWLITPPIALNQPYHLSFKVGGSTHPDRAAEHYSVLISTTSIDPSDFTEVLTETLNPNDYTETITGMPSYGLKTISIPLGAYIGETIHIAFRHWGVTNQEVLMLTDIKILDGGDVSIADMFNDENNPLRAWVQDNRLYVGGLTAGERWNVYTVTGRLVYQGIANSDIVNIKLAIRGVYIIQSGNRTVKVVY